MQSWEISANCRCGVLHVEGARHLRVEVDVEGVFGLGCDTDNICDIWSLILILALVIAIPCCLLCKPDREDAREIWWNDGLGQIGTLQLIDTREQDAPWQSARSTRGYSSQPSLVHARADARDWLSTAYQFSMHVLMQGLSFVLNVKTPYHLCFCRGRISLIRISSISSTRVQAPRPLPGWCVGFDLLCKLWRSCHPISHALTFLRTSICGLKQC